MLIPSLVLMFLVITKKDIFEQYFSKNILNKLSIANKYMSKITRNILFFIATILMTISLARPVTHEKELNFKQEVSAIVIAIDVSKSMLANDISPNRLTFAKRKLLSIIENAKQNSLAVILFAKSSFILSPITQDFNSLKILINSLDTGINFDNGSNIFSTLEASVKLLKDYENKNLLLLTDGGNNISFDKEINFAKKNNINVYTLALASKKSAHIKLENGDFLTKDDGSIVTVPLNENIKKLSLNTNGGYINYSLNDEDIKQILLDIEKKSTKKAIDSKKFKTYTELFYYPLALALFILFIAFSSLPSFFSKRFVKLFIMIFVSFNLSEIHAFEFDFKTIKKAKNFYEKEEFKNSAKEFEKVAKTPEAKYNYANSLYKAKEYEKALKTYQDIVTSNQELEYKKLHNLGNSYVKLNDLENAKKMYEKALEIKADEQTSQNLETIQNILNKKKENKQENKENNSKQNKEQKNQDNKDNKKEENSQKIQNQEEKEKQENRENNSKQNKEQKNQDNKDNKKEENSQKVQNQEEKEKQQNSNINKNLQKNEISDLEEQKWLKTLENKRNQVLLKRVQTKNEDNSINPW